MNARVFAIRPQPGLSTTVEAGRALGLDIEERALAEIHSVAWNAPPDKAFDALLLGSANAVRHAGPALARWRGRVAHVVGEATAAAAREAGLAIGLVGQGGLQQVVDASAGPDGLRLLRLAGAKHAALVSPNGVAIDTRVVYRVAYHRVAPPLAAELEEGGIVLVHSGEAARHFADECDRLGIARDRVSLAALAPRVAQAAGTGWRRVAVAPRPTDSALLAMVRDMCH